MVNEAGTLFIVSTPIGNLKDITIRALETLQNVGTIVCEDTRVTSILLSKYDIKKPLIALNDYNESNVIYSIIGSLERENIALVSDSGTPLISDPGFKLVSQARKKGYKIVPIPGPTALIAALSASALPTDRFVFLGFLPKAPSKAEGTLEAVKGLDATVIIYESPHRLLQTLKVIENVNGNIEIVLARELTKKFEEIKTKKIADHLLEYISKNPKGEYVILYSTKN